MNAVESISADEVEPTIIRIRGKNTVVPSAEIEGRKVVVRGRFLRIAEIFDEELVEGDPVANPSVFITKLRACRLKADVFTFAQRPPAVTPRWKGNCEWDNWAIAHTSSFKNWWEKLPQESRKNVRRSAKKGVTVRTIGFDDELVRGIEGIYNESPVRQGKKFWHYGKDFATVKMENATYIERSEFIGAFCGDTLIGFIKMIFVDQAAILIQILAKNDHHDKRPMNALLAHAVEVCSGKNLESLVYGKYVYGRKNDSSLTEFKRRNGFEQVNFPRYYIPLSMKGTAVISSGLHLGSGNLLPKKLTNLLLAGRAWLVKKTTKTPSHLGAG